MQIVAPRAKKFETSGEIEGIPIITEYKYLGVYLNNNIKWNNHLDHVKKKKWIL